MRDITSKFIGLIIVFMLLGVTPLFYTSIIEVARDQEIILNSTQDLIDGVIDTGVLTEEALEEYYSLISMAGGYYNVTILHKVKVINPDPLTGGTTTYTSYVVVDDIYDYEQGDKIIVKVEPLGETFYQQITRAFLGLTATRDGFTLSGRVR